MPGSLSGLGLAAKRVSRRAVVSAIAFVTNHGGRGDVCNSPARTERGNGANGAQTTLFCGRSNSRALWTTPAPDWMSVRSWPGNAPHDA